MLVHIIIAATIALTKAINCPQKTNMQDFSVSKYLGVWYEAYSFGANNYNDDFKCPKEVFTQEPDNITIVDSGEKLKEPGAQTLWPGYVTLAEPGQLVVQQDFGTGSLVTYTLNILETDYDNWAVVWSCPGFNNRENSWIMTRKRLNYGERLPRPQRQQITSVLRREDIYWSNYTRSPNFNCTY